MQRGGAKQYRGPYCSYLPRWVGKHHPRETAFRELNKGKKEHLGIVIVSFHLLKLKNDCSPGILLFAIHSIINSQDSTMEKS